MRCEPACSLNCKVLLVTFAKNGLNLLRRIREAGIHLVVSLIFLRGFNEQDPAVEPGQMGVDGPRCDERRRDQDVLASTDELLDALLIGFGQYFEHEREIGFCSKFFNASLRSCYCFFVKLLSTLHREIDHCTANSGYLACK